MHSSRTSSTCDTTSESESDYTPKYSQNKKYTGQTNYSNASQIRNYGIYNNAQQYYQPQKTYPSVYGYDNYGYKSYPIYQQYPVQNHHYPYAHHHQHHQQQQQTVPGMKTPESLSLKYAYTVQDANFQNRMKSTMSSVNYPIYNPYMKSNMLLNNLNSPFTMSAIQMNLAQSKLYPVNSAASTLSIDHLNYDLKSQKSMNGGGTGDIPTYEMSQQIKSEPKKILPRESSVESGLKFINKKKVGGSAANLNEDDSKLNESKLENESIMKMKEKKMFTNESDEEHKLRRSCTRLRVVMTCVTIIMILIIVAIVLAIFLPRNMASSTKSAVKPNERILMFNDSKIELLLKNGLLDPIIVNNSLNEGNKSNLIIAKTNEILKTTIGTVETTLSTTRKASTNSNDISTEIDNVKASEKMLTLTEITSTIDATKKVTTEQSTKSVIDLTTVDSTKFALESSTISNKVSDDIESAITNEINTTETTSTTEELTSINNTDTTMISSTDKITSDNVKKIVQNILP